MPSNDSSRANKILSPGPFLGRRAELAQLCRKVEEACLGTGDRLWIVGPHGIGKSRLLAEIAQYGALRNVPVERASTDLDPHALPIGPGVLIVDPVANGLVSSLEEPLRRASERGILALATTTSSAGKDLLEEIPDTAVMAIEGLDSDDSLRLLRAWLGPALDPAWARRIARATRGHPGRMRRAAEHFLTMSRPDRARDQATPPSDV